MRALIVVDIQNDFLPGGALGVPHGDEVIPLLNKIMGQFALVIATQDWHPANHKSFASQHPGHKPGDIVDLHGIDQILWPDHCIQNTPGSEFAAALETQRLTKVFQKGANPEVDSYSTFWDNGRRRSTGLDFYLRQRGIKEIVLAGLATDYCVKYSAVDAVWLGFHPCIYLPACRPVELTPGDEQRAITEMHRAGAEILHTPVELDAIAQT